jgi:hypothetical protein
MKHFLAIGTFIFVCASRQLAALDVGWELLDFAQMNRTSAPSFQSSYLQASHFSITSNILNENEYKSAHQTLSGNNWPQTPTPDLTKYFEATFTPSSGASIDFTTFQIPLWRETDVNDVGPRFWVLRSSRDGYVSNIGAPIDTLASDFALPLTANFDLSAFSGINAPLTFRLYGYAAPNASGSGGVHIDRYKVYLTATVVPEPSLIPLLLLGSLLIFWKCRNASQGAAASPSRQRRQAL